MRNKKAWLAFLGKHGFEKVAVDPQAHRRVHDRTVYRNKEDVHIVVQHQSPIQNLFVKGGEENYDLGYMRFEAPKLQAGSGRNESIVAYGNTALGEVLGAFRGPVPLKGTDIQGPDLDGIVVYVKEETPWDGGFI